MRARRVLVSALLAIVPTAIAAPAALAGPLEIDAIQADALHRYGVDGSGVTVAVIDSGVEPLPQLHGALVAQVNFSDGPSLGDQYGHGTFVAGLVHEAAPGARILSLKLSNADGAVDVAQVIAALQWLAQHGDEWSVDVVNLSFGTDSTQSPASSPLNFAVQRVWDAGMVVVTSAGNVETSEGRVTKPGDDPLVVTVGASDARGSSERWDDVVAPFSAQGPTAAGIAKPDVVAPGRSVTSLRAPGSTIDLEHPEARMSETAFRGSGTSFATPLVSGAAALLLQVRPGLHPDQVKHALRETAQPISGPSQAQGTGTVRATRAAWVAATTTVGRANRSVTRSDGRGSMRGARGRARAMFRLQSTTTTTAPATTTTTLSTTSSTTTTTLEPEVALTVDQLDPIAFDVDASWDASRWGASRWGASRWGASRWGAIEWASGIDGDIEFWASRWG